MQAAYAALKRDINSRSETPVYMMLGDDWPNGVLFLETVVAAPDEISAEIHRALASMFDAEGCRFSLCMYDGAFNHYESFFSPDFFDQLYAFAFGKNDHVVNLDASLLASGQWKDIIAACRLRASI
ncbi:MULTISPECIES: hypothetical protein [unclassified Xanthomonas]|uniref:hypothetical protein n=1 Tax=Xanthomonas sp. LMG 9002 TaxID=1591158 RepID=UPI001371AECA|nr:hypothetical protein [Xanthomonas sp. LMG 9002]